MDCKHCATPVDYRYLTVCPQCAFDLPLNDPVPDCSKYSDLPDTPIRKRTFGLHFANAFFVLLTSFTGMFLGAIAMYFVGALIFIAFLNEPSPHSCGRGTAIAFLSILLGGFLGCTGGSILGYRNRMSSNS